MSIKMKTAIPVLLIMMLGFNVTASAGGRGGNPLRRAGRQATAFL